MEGIYTPITALGDIVMLSFAPGLGPQKFFVEVLKPQGFCQWRAVLPWWCSLAAQPGARAVGQTPPLGGAAQRLQSPEELLHTIQAPHGIPLFGSSPLLMKGSGPISALTRTLPSSS